MKRALAAAAVAIGMQWEAQAQAQGQAQAQEVTVKAARPARESVTVTVTEAEAKKVPGTQGDATKVVQALPGVARPSFGTGQLVVWGSAPADTRVYVDGVEIPALYHGGAIRGTVNGDLVRSIAVIPGGYGVDYGLSLGGIVELTTKELPGSGQHGYVAVDTLDASAMAGAALGDKLRVAVAGRYGYIDRLLSWVSAPDIGDYYAIPSYRDYQLKATYALSESESLSLVGLGSGDDLTRTIASSDPASTRRETTQSTYHRLYARYSRRGDDGERTEVTPFVGYDTDDRRASFGAEPADLRVSTVRYGVRASNRSLLGDRVTLALGVDALGSSSSLARDGSLTLPPREGDITVFGQAPSGRVASDDWTANVVDVGPHAALTVRAGKLTVTPGLRFDSYLVEASRSAPRLGTTPPIGQSSLLTAIDPRISASYAVSPALTVNAAAGSYHQPPDPRDLAAVFGTPALTLSHGTHLTAGQLLRVSRTLSIETTVFYKTATDLPVRSRLPEPKLALALVQDGQSRAYGAQVLIRRQLANGLFGWLSYTISRSDRKYLYDAGYRLFDYDQPHVLSAVLSQAAGPWTFGARFQYASGMPRTPVIGATFDASSDRYDPVFGGQNTVRLPAFYELDLRAERRFELGRDVALSLFVDALNVTFHKNAEEIAYSSDYTTHAYITGIPTLAVVGARVEF